MTDKVLLIETSPFIQSQLAPFFRNKGIHLTIASSGIEASTILSKSFPDAIVIELPLPDIEGLSFIRSIRKTRPTIKVMVIASSIDKGLLTELIQLGVKNIFIKPFSIETLLATIQASP